MDTAMQVMPQQVLIIHALPPGVVAARGAPPTQQQQQQQNQHQQQQPPAAASSDAEHGQLEAEGNVHTGCDTETGRGYATAREAFGKGQVTAPGTQGKQLTAAAIATVTRPGSGLTPAAGLKRATTGAGRSDNGHGKRGSAGCVSRQHTATGPAAAAPPVAAAGHGNVDASHAVDPAGMQQGGVVDTPHPGPAATTAPAGGGAAYGTFRAARRSIVQLLGDLEVGVLRACLWLRAPAADVSPSMPRVPACT